jgi:transcription antitermination factor NusA-like protein
LVKSLIPKDEVDPLKLDPAQRQLYDWEAWERLCRGESDAHHDFKLLNLDDEVVREGANLAECRSLFNELRELEVRRVAQRYAYMTMVNFYDNRLSLVYASSSAYFEAFERLKGQYGQLVDSLNHMMWDSIKYVEYVVMYSGVEQVRRRVWEFYSNIPGKYIDVLVFDDEVQIFVPRQLRGRVIGRGGMLVDRLQRLLGRHVSVVVSPSLTELYETEHPELPKDPEVFQLVAQLAAILEKLEKKGVTLRQVERVIEEMRRPEEESGE